MVDAMSDALNQVYPKDCYFIASWFDKACVYMAQFLPISLTDRVILLADESLATYRLLHYFVSFSSLYSPLILLFVAICRWSFS